MPSLVRKKSYGSVKVFWFDREKAVRLFTEKAKRCGSQRPEVIRVGVFGSLATGRAVPGSDADVIIIVSESEKRMLDRYDDYIQFFDGIDMGVDLFCYPESEARRIPLARQTCARALWLFQPEGQPTAGGGRS